MVTARTADRIAGEVRAMAHLAYVLIDDRSVVVRPDPGGSGDLIVMFRNGDGDVRRLVLKRWWIERDRFEIYDQEFPLAPSAIKGER